MSRYSVGMLLAALIFLFADVAMAKSCTSSDLESCMTPVRAFSQNFKPVSTNELKHVCREFQTMNSCINDFVKECLTYNHEGRKGAEAILKGASEFMKQFCDESSSLHQEYVKYGSCMATATDEVEVCSKKVKKSLEQTTSTTRDEAKLTEAICCALKRHQDCVVGAYTDKCGDDAGRVVDVSLKLMYGGLVQDKCSDEHGNLQCSSAFMVRPATILFALAAILWACQRKLW